MSRSCGIEIPPVFTEDELVEMLRRGIDRLERDTRRLIAVSLQLDPRDPSTGTLMTIGRTIWRPSRDPASAPSPLVVLVDGDVGKTIGHLLRDELGLACELISIDGVDLHDCDFVDVGEMVTPPGVIPLVIKSLVFS